MEAKDRKRNMEGRGSRFASSHLKNGGFRECSADGVVDFLLDMLSDLNISVAKGFRKPLEGSSW